MQTLRQPTLGVRIPLAGAGYDRQGQGRRLGPGRRCSSRDTRHHTGGDSEDRGGKMRTQEQVWETARKRDGRGEGGREGGRCADVTFPLSQWRCVVLLSHGICLLMSCVGQIVLQVHNRRQRHIIPAAQAIFCSPAILKEKLAYRGNCLSLRLLTRQIVAWNVTRSRSVFSKICQRTSRTRIKS